MLVFEVRKFAESTYKRRRNLAKVYLIDTALSKRTTSADIGRILENIVFLELKRRGSETFYFEEERGCDFIVKNGKESLCPIQVCYELTEENREREFQALLVACKWTNSSDGILLTYDEADEITIDEINIKIIPVWVWLCK